MLFISVDETLTLAVLAAREKMLAVWHRNGEKDCGACGGAICQLDGRTVLANRALARGFAYQSGREIFVMLQRPDTIHSQNADIDQEGMRAFRETLIAHGHANAIKKYWNYID